MRSLEYLACKLFLATWSGEYQRRRAPCAGRHGWAGGSSGRPAATAAAAATEEEEEEEEEGDGRCPEGVCAPQIHNGTKAYSYVFATAVDSTS